ncbi:MAG: PTS sugar transporter subunit IIA [SAR324 cluster bacterium]|nr:PTS sugar transporter subunit IIA [SAR324 cluster bacterium]
MQLNEFLKESLIISQFEADSKSQALQQLVEQLSVEFSSINKESILNLIIEREGLITTGIGSGVAVPHCKSSEVNELTVVLARSSKGIDFEALDGEPCYLFFMLIAPENSTSTHLKALAKIARIAKDEKIRAGLEACESSAEMLSFITEQEHHFS